MARKFLILIAIILFYKVNAQSGFGESMFVGNDFSSYPWKIYSSDIDGNGFNDVIFCNSNAHLVAWYKNIDGQGTFSTIQYIDQNLNYTQSVITADLDGDGDQDILASSSGANKVVWYENTDGLGNFSTAKIIAINTPGARPTLAVDIDGDGDLDVVFGITNAAKIVWCENLDGQANFGAEIIIATGIGSVLSLDVGDINGDGYIDIVCNSSSSNYPSWFKNLDGLGSFGTEQLISNDTFGSSEIIVKDIDGDGALDVFNLEAGGETIAWYKNLDGLGNFGTKQIIQNTNFPSTMYAEDMDNDGDIDLLATLIGDLKKVWYENLDGLGTFSDEIVFDNLSSSTLFAEDIDNDNYKDIISSINSNEIVWYKNETYLGVEEASLLNISITPNPTKGSLLITGIAKGTKTTLKLYDVVGKEVLSLNTFIPEINLINLIKGLYFLEITTSDGSIVKKVIKE